MKFLLLSASLLSFLTSLPAFADQVQCPQGVSAGGCYCQLDGSGNMWTYYVVVNGTQIFDAHLAGKPLNTNGEEALYACRQHIKNSPACN